jgi:hypothetical protein
VRSGGCGPLAELRSVPFLRSPSLRAVWLGLTTLGKTLPLVTLLRSPSLRAVWLGLTTLGKTLPLVTLLRSPRWAT